MNPTRTRLGRSAHVFGREDVYEVPDGLEVETRENYEVIRKRVLFEDVQLATYHREIGAWFVALMGLTGGFFLFLGMVILNAEPRFNVWTLLPWLVMAFPFLLAASLRAIYGVEVVTICGRRSKAMLRFGRKKKAREIYGRILTRVRQAQSRLEREIAESSAAEVPQAPEMPPMPMPESAS